MNVTLNDQLLLRYITLVALLSDICSNRKALNDMCEVIHFVVTNVRLRIAVAVVKFFKFKKSSESGVCFCLNPSIRF